MCQSGVNAPGPETVCPNTALSQIATAPESLCQRMSLWWLPSKSPTPATCQLLGIEAAIVDGFVACPLFQIVTAPLLLSCQRMSDLPLPSKSPTPTTCQVLGKMPAPAMPCPIVALSQIATAP